MIVVKNVLSNFNGRIYAHKNSRGGTLQRTREVSDEDEVLF